MYKIDLHTHSIISHDGGITKKQYIRLLEDSSLDCIAITDHNETSFARSLHRELGSKIIVGEEIKTLDGEIIGLFLTKTIPPGKTARETVNEIHLDGGLVYIPHPFETKRYGLQQDAIDQIIKDVDIVEVFNARGILRGKPEKANRLATQEKLSMAASSDAHCKIGIGSSYSIIRKFPDSKSLTKLLRKGVLEKKYAPFVSLLCPSVNKIKNKLFLGV